MNQDETEIFATFRVLERETDQHLKFSHLY